MYSAATMTEGNAADGLFSSAWLLSDTHQGEYPGEREEQGRRPGGEKRGEDARLPEGDKDVEGYAVGKGNDDADHDVDGDSS